jgi:hypothetical protein
MKIDWINAWKGENKKAKYGLTFRLGKLTVFEVEICPCNDDKCSKFKVILLNLGFEL